MRSLLILLTLASAAVADELTLRNGSTFSGVVREQGDKVTIEMDYGSMTFKKIDVRSVVKGRDPIGEFNRKVAVATSTRDLAAIAAWALDQGLRGRAESVYRTILVREPEHAEARRALGFEKVGGRWLAGDDLLIAWGLVKVDGRWISKEEADRLLAEAAAAAEPESAPVESEPQPEPLPAEPPSPAPILGPAVPRVIPMPAWMRRPQGGAFPPIQIRSK
jgi:hypothetical protein